MLTNDVLADSGRPTDKENQMKIYYESEESIIIPIAMQKKLNFSLWMKSTKLLYYWYYLFLKFELWIIKELRGFGALGRQF